MIPNLSRKIPWDQFNASPIRVASKTCLCAEVAAVSSLSNIAASAINVTRPFPTLHQAKSPASEIVHLPSPVATNWPARLTGY